MGIEHHLFLECCCRQPIIPTAEVHEPHGDHDRQALIRQDFETALGEVDAVVTMYHDQGQIAIKLLGFERGVTVAGGLPIPVATPAHGTAFDITGKNKANVSATRQAFNLLVSMANIHRTERDTTLGRDTYDKN